MAEAAADENGGGPPVPARPGPTWFRFDNLLAHVDGATNAVVVEGNFSGRLLFQGAGAGDGPTASAVVADIIDIARGMDSGFEADRAFSIPVAGLEAMVPADSGQRISRAYIRFTVDDRPGVLAGLTADARRGRVYREPDPAGPPR